MEFFTYVWFGALLFCAFFFRSHVVIHRKVDAITEAVDKIALAARIGQVIEIKGAEDITPEDFAPKKDVLRVALHAAANRENNPHMSPGTWAFCVLDRSGLALFLDDQIRSKIQGALGRLRVNGDAKAIHRLLDEIIDAL